VTAGAVLVTLDTTREAAGGADHTSIPHTIGASEAGSIPGPGAASMSRRPLLTETRAETCPPYWTPRCAARSRSVRKGTPSSDTSIERMFGPWFQISASVSRTM
jgi:hypothetical protein